MHHHGHENEPAPFEGDGKAGSQDEQWRKRGQMCVRRGKQQSTERDPEKTAEVALEDTINKESKKELLNDGSNCDRKHNDHHSLLNRSRPAKKFDDVLLA